MILHDFLRALGQISDPRFRRVLLIGLALTIALLVAVYLAFLWAVQTFVPDTVTLPYIGPINGVEALVSWGSALVVSGLSIFLMVPVAAMFTGFFLEDVVQAVEDRHYPGLPPVPRAKLMDAMIDSFNFFALLVAVNILALILYAFSGPFIPVVFWAINGLLLGREYFTLVAQRRLGRAGAKAMRRRYGAQIWLAGTLMAAPLSIPLINLFIPVLGAATFSHMFQRLNTKA